MDSEVVGRALRRLAEGGERLFEWQAFVKMSGEAGHLIKQENQILVPAPFFKLER